MVKRIAATKNFILKMVFGFLNLIFRKEKEKMVLIRKNV